MSELFNLFIRNLRIEWSEIGERSYLREIPAVANLTELDFTKNITFFVGENGTGKSTLLEAAAVAYGFNPEGSYFFRAESFFNVATKAEDYRDLSSVPVMYGGRALHRQSHGESFLAFFQSFSGRGLHLMDEPEAALSPQRQLTLFIQIARMAAEGAQFIIATHSPILLGIPGAEILSFDEGEVRSCRYEETESYQVTEMFMNNREKLIERLLKNED